MNTLKENVNEVLKKFENGGVTIDEAVEEIVSLPEIALMEAKTMAQIGLARKANAQANEYNLR